MLEAFEIITTSGIVLWRKHYTPLPLQSNLINSLISDVFIEERQRSVDNEPAAAAPTYRKDKYTLRYTTAKTAKDVGLIFVAVYQSLLQLSWVSDLLTAVRGLFLKQYKSELDAPIRLDSRGFDQTFDALVSKLDTGSTRRRASETDQESQVEFTPPSSSASAADENENAPPPPPPSIPQHKKPAQVMDDTTSADVTPIATPDTSRPTTPLHPPSHLLAAKAGPAKQSRRARKAANAFNSSAPASSGDESDRRPKSGKTNVKAKRRWDNGLAVDGDDDEVLDYSAAPAPNSEEEKSLDIDNIKAEQMGSRTGKGQFVLKDLDDEVSVRGICPAMTSLPNKSWCSVFLQTTGSCCELL